MFFHRRSRRERMAAAARRMLPSRRTVAVVTGVAALGAANARVSAARQNSS